MIFLTISYQFFPIAHRVFGMTSFLTVIWKLHSHFIQTRVMIMYVRIFTWRWPFPKLCIVLESQITHECIVLLAREGYSHKIVLAVLIFTLDRSGIMNEANLNVHVGDYICSPWNCFIVCIKLRRRQTSTAHRWLYLFFLELFFKFASNMQGGKLQSAHSHIGVVFVLYVIVSFASNLQDVENV